MIINKKSQTDLSGFYIVYNGSVLNESKNNYGISHLMEHLMCKEFEHLYDEFDEFGISWNAYTSNNQIIFYMTGLDEHVYKYRHEFLNSILKFTVSEKEFKTEKDVVIQEYLDNFQDHESYVFNNLIRKEYKCYNPIGKLESLKNITLDDCKDYFKKYLSKPSIIINISKNNKFEGFDNFNKKSPTKFKPDSNDKLKIEKIIDFDKLFIYGFNKVNKDFAKIKFVANMIGGTMKSPLFMELREKRGLTYTVYTFVFKVSDTEGLLFTGINTSADKKDLTLEVYEDVLTNRDKYLTKKQFDIIKNKKLVSKKKKEINRYNNIDEYLEPDEWSDDKMIEDFTFEDAQKIYDEYFKFNKLTWDDDKNGIK